MVPVSIFLLFVGCMVVNCNLVGHGGHWLINNKIVKLNGNTKIAENPDDLKLYKELESSCDVEMVEGNIKIWYQKNTPTANKGCSIDLVTKNVDQLTMKFGIWHINGNIAECLPENILPFSISLKDKELDNIKDEPILDTSNECKNLRLCPSLPSDCLKLANYIVTYIKTEDNLLNYILMVLNSANVDKPPNNEKQVTVQTSLDLLLNGNFVIKDCTSKSVLNCIKNENIRKPEVWEITDENYKNNGFKSLFTFHLLPLNAARRTLQKFLKECSDETNKEEASKLPLDDAKFQRCDKMFIEFDKENIKLLVPDAKKEDKNEVTEVGNLTTIQETTGTTTEPTTTITTEVSGMKSSIVIVIIIVVIVL
uniref:Uncharacterized protein n=1 Tax=Meloidogyne incognita TaxID=6306 RepID=A0A914ML92_MELIC